MAHRLLQANINHCRAAQDLLVQSMAEWLIDVAVVAEPYFVPPTGNWVGDQDGLVAIASSRTLRVPPLTVIKRGRGYVAVRWRDYVLIGVYFSPNKILADFEEFLGGLETLIGQIQTRHVLVLGDLNAKSTAWGSPKTDARGVVLEEWATTTGLLVLNQGSVNTCVRQRGGVLSWMSLSHPPLWQTLSGAEMFWRGWKHFRIIFTSGSTCPPRQNTRTVVAQESRHRDGCWGALTRRFW
ncbi:uncharacterized protein [Epargyreus clarus]|uniref:uncharacterized protein n=1 Tax=Epargyreus clarus TaxID=520877 RepID=UPI003C2F9B08